MTSADKRADSRVPFTEEVDYFCWHERRRARASGIFQGGLFLCASEVLPEGSLLTLRLRLPGMAAAFTVLGRVVHVVFGGERLRRGMGVRFLDIAPRDRESIRTYASHRPALALVV